MVNKPHPIKQTPMFGFVMMFLMVVILASFAIMVYFSMYYPTPSDMQSSTYDTCKTVFIAGISGFSGIIFGKNS